MPDITVIATSAITGAVTVLGALVGALASAHTASVETRRRNWEYQVKRRGERQETYQTAIDLLTDWGWRSDTDPNFDVVRDFTIPFVRAANRVRVYGSPASIAAMDAIQEGFAKLNRAGNESERAAADDAISAGHDSFVIAARADVGPRDEDGLEKVPFRPGAGPPA
jgi:hypothetical protein